MSHDTPTARLQNPSGPLFTYSPEAADRLARTILDLLPSTAPQVFVDPKADPTLAPALSAMLERGVVYQEECQRRGVKFLPLQVLRPLYAAKGLSVGPRMTPRPTDFFTIKT